MTSTENKFKARASAIAVRGALVALALTPAVHAAEGDEVRAQTQPANTVEIGVGVVDKGSYKFGEFNGLEKKGAYLNGGFNVRGGGSYDSDSALRWRIYGNDLGLNIRSLGAEFGEQGKFRINFGYDEIQRNQYDSYQTPYSGVGSKTLTLPGNLNAANHPAAITVTNASCSTALANCINSTTGVTTTRANTPANVTTATNVTTANLLASPTNIQSPNLNPGTAAVPNTVAAASAAAANAGLGWLIPAAMHNENIGTQRARRNVGIDLVLTPQLGFSATARQETKDGLRLTGVGSVSTGAGVTVPELLQYTTNLYNAALNYAGDNTHINVGYSGSLFRNGVDTWTADSIWGNNTVQGNVNRMIGAPDNQMHQLKLAGGYNFSKATKLTVVGSFGESTQNEGFISPGPFWYVPESSAHAKVVNKNFLARVTSRATNDLSLLASYRYEDRDNRTPYLQTISTGRDAVGAVATTNPCGPGALAATAAVLVSSLTCYDNQPINIRQKHLVLEGDYRFARGQAFKAGYDWQEIRRTSDVATQDPFRAHETKEHTLRFQYRNSMAENLNGRIGYEHSRRRHSEFELEDPLGGVLAAAVEPMLPNLITHMVANRDRDKIRSALAFQPSDRLSLGAGLDYNNDKYKDSDLYGKKFAKSWVLNLDASYAASEKVGLSAFYTYEDQKQETNSLSILRGTNVASFATPVPIQPTAAACGPYPSTSGYTAGGGALNYGSPADWNSDPCRVWSERQSDKVHTFGVSFKAKASPKLDVDGALVYTYALTPISFSGLQVVNNGLAIGAVGAAAASNNNIFIQTASMPDSSSKTWDVRLSGRYLLNKSSSLRVNYLYRRLISSDAQWDAYASNPVAIQGYVGTGRAAPTYNVNAISLSYIYTFN